MVDFMRRAAFGRQPASDDAVPEEIARALDASAEDVRNDRTVDIGEFLKSMQAKLEAHRARKGGFAQAESLGPTSPDPGGTRHGP